MVSGHVCFLLARFSSAQTDCCNVSAGHCMFEQAGAGVALSSLAAKGSDATRQRHLGIGATPHADGQSVDDTGIQVERTSGLPNMPVNPAAVDHLLVAHLLRGSQSEEGSSEVHDPHRKVLAQCSVDPGWFWNEINVIFNLFCDRIAANHFASQ